MFEMCGDISRGYLKGVCGHERVLEKVGGPELTCKIKKIYIEFR